MSGGLARVLYISGASDDLVEVGGDVSLEGAAGPGDTLDVYVNGAPAVRVTYEANGTWSVRMLDGFDGLDVGTHHRAVDEDLHKFHPAAPESCWVRPYSEVVVLEGSFWSVKCGEDEWTATPAVTP